MRAMRLSHIAPIETNPLEMVEEAAPEPAAGEVRIKVSCCAICRTDLHVIEGDLPPQCEGVVPGHQIVGVVEKLGPDCRRLKVGDRVGAAWLRYTCGICRFCSSGRENLCPYSRYTGYHADGGYAEYAVVLEDFAYEIPPVFDDVQAAPLLCSGIIGYHALKRSNLPSGGRLGIFGFGSSAHIVFQVAMARGSPVYVVTRETAHQELARRMGAAWSTGDAATLPVKLDSVILFAPVGRLAPTALEALERGGTLALAGIHMTPIPELDYDRFLFYERDIHPVTSNTRADGRELLAEAARIPIRPHVTLYPLEETNRALQDLKAGRIEGSGVVMMA